MTNYTLLVHDEYSFVNGASAKESGLAFEGIWGIRTQKKALACAEKLMAAGHRVRVMPYGNPRYFKAANRFIKELRLSQRLFQN